MKKTFITCSLIALAMSSLAQKMQKPIIDKITGDTTWRTSRERICTKTNFLGSDILFTYALKTKATTLLAFSLINGQGPIIFSINEGNKAILKLKDGKIITLTSLVSRTSDIDFAMIGGIDASSSSNLAFYKIDNDAITVLKNGKIAVIRIETSKGNFDYEIKDRNSEIIGKSLALIIGK